MTYSLSIWMPMSFWIWESSASMSPAHMQQAPDCSTSSTSAPSCARCRAATTPVLPPPTTTTSWVSVALTWSATEAGCSSHAGAA